MNWTTRILAVVLAAVLVGGGVYAAYSTGFDDGAHTATVAGDNTGTVVPVDSWRSLYGWHGGFGFFPFSPSCSFSSSSGSSDHGAGEVDPAGDGTDRVDGANPMK